MYEQEISTSESNLKRKWNDEDFRIYKEEIALGLFSYCYIEFDFYINITNPKIQFPFSNFS